MFSRVYRLFLVGLVSSVCFGETTKTIYNPFTRQPDYITSVSSQTLPPGSTQYIQNTSTPQSNSSFNVTSGTVSGTLTVGTCIGCGGGGSSSLGVNYNGVSITTPTAQINFIGSGVSVVANGSTATVTVSGGGGGTPGGPNLGVQFNNSGVFSGTTDFTVGSSSVSISDTMSLSVSSNVYLATGATFYSNGQTLFSKPVWIGTNTATAVSTDLLFASGIDGVQANMTLSIGGASSTSGNYFIKDRTTANNNTILRLAPASATSSTMLNVPLTANFSSGAGSSGGTYIGASAPTGTITLYTGGQTVGSSERVRISSTGLFGIGTTTPTQNLSFGSNEDKTIAIERSTSTLNAGRTLNVSAGSAGSGSTDLGSTLALNSGITTGGALGKINLNPASIQTTGTGPVLEVLIEDPYQDNVSGYTVGNTLTMVGAGSGTATIIIDEVNSNGVPTKWHIGTGGTGYAYQDFSFPTGGTGINAVFYVERISGSTDNSTATTAYADARGLHTTSLFTTGDNYLGYDPFGGNYGLIHTFTNGDFIQEDQGQVGSTNRFQSRSVFGTLSDAIGASFSSAVHIKQGVYGLSLEASANGTSGGWNNFMQLGVNHDQNIQYYGNGDTEYNGEVNAAAGGMGTIQNYYTWSEDPTDASYVKTRVTATSGTVVAPDGNRTGSTMTTQTTASLKRVDKVSASLPAGNYVVSIYMASSVIDDAMSVAIVATGVSNSYQFSNLPLGGTGSWTRYKIPFTTTGAGTVTFRLQPNSGQVFYQYGLQLVDANTGNSAGVYTKTQATNQTGAVKALFSNNNIVTQGNIGIDNFSPIYGLDVSSTVRVSSNTILPGATFYQNGPIALGPPGYAVQISSNLIISGATFYQGITPSLVAGTNITSITGTWPNQTINAATQSGGGSSPLAVTTGSASGFTAIISSPTSVVDFDSSTFKVSLKGSATAFVQLNASSVTLQGLITAASLGALTANQSITITGDSTGSGTTAITLTAAGTQANIRTFTGPITHTSSDTINGVLRVSTNTLISNSIIANQGKQPTGSASFLVYGSTVSRYEIYSSTDSQGAYAVAVTTSSHFSTGASSPVVISCGTSPTVTGNDIAGTITPGATAAGCTITFGTPYTNAPSCVVSQRTGSLVNALSYTVTKSALTLTETSFTSIFDYHCIGLNE